ncbi:Growth hormone-inducible transmembrane protein [Heterocephalus glaber]|uniref:Growth hormone-inducible transmembrane protein n=1 Tax=Heterocephalus glaber TaxID=10181 RepID=G5AL49_HETGA|nr:Growth hormone-inducible transmembrane protein [Heterocephalus glaber]
MLAAMLVCLRTLPFKVFHLAFTKATSPVVKSSITKNQWLLKPSREYATRSRIGIRRGKTAQELKEAALEPSMEKIFKINQMGKWFVAGGAGVGVGALCYYGLGMSNEIGAIEKAVIWPQATWYTASIMGCLSTVAMCARSEKFLKMGVPLGVALGLVFSSSLGSMFLPPTSVAGATLYSVAVYGGLVLFSVFLLHDTQKVIKRREITPMYGVQKYDPINSMLAIYMDTLNIFMLVATMLATGTNRKK